MGVWLFGRGNGGREFRSQANPALCALKGHLNFLASEYGFHMECIELQTIRIRSLEDRLA
jgi:hypothetical protein